MNLDENNKLNKLVSKSKKGDINASYDLFTLYKNGKYIEQDDLKAQEFLNAALIQFKKQKIELTHLSLLNFRIINRFKLDMTNNKIQVLVGNNGAGKTTILDSIGYSLSWLIQRIVHKGGRAREIEKSDISLGNNDGYSSIIAKVKLRSDFRSTIELCEVEEGSIANKKSYFTDFTRLGNLYKLACEEDELFSLPLLAYYGVMRSNDINSKDVAEFDETSVSDIGNRFEGYTNSLSGKADFRSFFRWYKRLDDVVKHEASSSPKTDPKLLSTLETLALTDAHSKEILDGIIANLKKNEDEGDRSIAKKRQEVINKAVNIFMDGFNNLCIELTPTLHLSIKKNNKKINILHLSQGEKSLLALILDICRRMMVLNPLSENPLETAGIVLIDEVDLHLHPEWQRNILKKLGKVFPNCQFIVSTHSPQIISEVKHSNVFILNKDEHGDFSASSPEQSYGLTSNQVLNEIMMSGTQRLDRSPEVQKRIDEIFNLIANGEFEKATRQINEMELQLNGEIPELVSAKFDIDIHGWDKE